MSAPQLDKAILAVLRNARRLRDDARELADMNRAATAYALCILAREEFAKALLLHLAKEQSLRWTPQLQRVLRNHRCKQLVSVIMEYLTRYDFPETHDDLMRDRKVRDLPRTIIDAVQILVHEHISRISREQWLDEEEPQLDHVANSVARGELDRKKHNGLYVAIGWNGAVTSVTSDPSSVSIAEVEQELEKLDRIAAAFHYSDGSLGLSTYLELPPIAALVRVLAGLMSPEEFNGRWW